MIYDLCTIYHLSFSGPLWGLGPWARLLASMNLGPGPCMAQNRARMRYLGHYLHAFCNNNFSVDNLRILCYKHVGDTLFPVSPKPWSGKMLLQKACKLFGSLNKPLWVAICTTICLCSPTDIKSQVIQYSLQAPPPVQYNDSTLGILWGHRGQSRCGPQGCGTGQRGPQGCGTGQCGPRERQAPQRPVQPPQRVPDAQRGGQRHPAEVQVKAVNANMSQHGFASFCIYKGKQYLISCAHTFKPGWKSYVIINGKDVEMTLLTAGRIADITIWAAPLQHPNPIPLAPKPATPETAVTVAGFAGTVLGYVGSDIEVRANVREGDSGGPIISSQGLVAILTEYAPEEGKCIGPNVLLISALLDGLAGPPQDNERPMVPVVPPVVVVESPQVAVEPFDDADIRARLDALENGVKINKDEIELHDQRIKAIEERTRENTISIQRVVGVVESLQKEVVQSGGGVETLTTQNRDLDVRVRRVEQSTATLSNTLKGKMQFRLRIDQSGRVIGVDPR